MDIDWFKASRMNKLSLNYRIDTMSEKMKDLLDEIYSLSRQGLFSINVNSLENKDIELLRALGYNVNSNNEFRVSPDRKMLSLGELSYEISWG